MMDIEERTSGLVFEPALVDQKLKESFQNLQ